MHHNIALLPKKVTNYVSYFLWKVMRYITFALLSRYFLNMSRAWLFVFVMNLVASHHTTAAHHPWTTTPIIHCTTTHTFPSTIAPITQLSPITNQPWLSCHTCTSFTHPHISSTLPYTRCEVLFCPGWHSERFPCILFPWTAYTTLTICCLPSWPCLPCDILCVCRLPRPLHCPCCWFCLAFITLVTAFDHCLSDLLFSVLKLQLDLTSLPLHYRF